MSSTMKYIVLFVSLTAFAWVSLEMPAGMSKYPRLTVNLQRAGTKHTIQFDTRSVMSATVDDGEDSDL